jgi:hypothetical protein
LGVLKLHKVIGDNDMANTVKCFFAYSARPPSLAEVVEKAIEEINKQGNSLVKSYGWKS